jgi:hypothetical protein
MKLLKFNLKVTQRNLTLLRRSAADLNTDDDFVEVNVKTEKKGSFDVELVTNDLYCLFELGYNLRDSEIRRQKLEVDYKKIN